jgi:hypothetical protein
MRPLNLELMPSVSLVGKFKEYGKHSSPGSNRSSVCIFRKSPRKKIQLERIEGLSMHIDSGPNYAGKALEIIREERLSETIRLSRRFNLATLKPLGRRSYWASSGDLQMTSAELLSAKLRRSSNHICAKQ